MRMCILYLLLVSVVCDSGPFRSDNARRLRLGDSSIEGLFVVYFLFSRIKKINILEGTSVRTMWPSVLIVTAVTKFCF